MFRKIKNKVADLILLRTAVKSLFLKSSGAGLNFILGVLIARALGASEFGLYSLVFAFVTMLGMLSNAGMPSFYTRETAILKSANKIEEIFSLAKSADKLLKYTTITSLILACIFIHFGIIGFTWNSISFTGWIMALSIILIFPLNAVRAAIIRGLDQVILADTPDIFIKPLFVIFLVLVGYYLSYKLTTSSIITMQFLAFSLVFCISTFNLNKNITSDSTLQVKKISNNVFNKNTTIFFFISFVTILQAQLPFYMTGYFLGTESAGYFQACLQLVNVLVIGLTAVNSPLQPKIASSWSKGDKIMVQKLVTESVRIASIISIAFFTIIYFGSEYFLAFYGEGFVEASMSLKLLLFGQLINAFCGPCALLLIMTNKQEIVLKGFFGSILVGLLLGLWAIPKYGIEGSAFVSIFIMMFWNIIMAYFCLKVLTINTLPIGRLALDKNIN
jgi:O-antigen/teichoic acid export membrane protein